MPIFGRPDKYSSEKGYSRIVWGERSKVLEIELTEMQKILQEHIRNLGKTVRENGFEVISPLVYSGGNLTIPAGAVVWADGIRVEIIDNMTISASNGDTVYLAVQEVEVSYTDTIRRSGNQSGGQVISDNGMFDSDIGVETSRRIQVQVELLKTNSTPGKVYLPVAEISGGVVTDLRVKAKSPDMLDHESSEAPHQYGGKFEWRYNPVFGTLDLVVIE